MLTPIYLYLVLVVLVAAQRIWELGRSKKNTVALKARGAIEVGAEHYPVMASLHTAWLVSCAVEAWLRAVPPSATLVVGAMVALAISR